MSTAKRKRDRERDTEPQPAIAVTLPHETVSPLFQFGTWLGLVLLYVAACVWGVLEVHYSNDTWIGLAAGRQILSEPRFPLADTFSYTSGGQTWFNQNWLSHVFFWLLYDKLGPTALVVGTWAVSVATFTLVLLAAWFRGRSWPAAFLGAAAVAIASRDWLSIRPATIQFFLLAAAWLAFSALLSQGRRRRWWPMAVLAVVYGVWPHAHGSLLLGFGMLGLFIGIAAAVGLLAKRFPVKTAISLPQTAVLIGLGILAVTLCILLSPYGVDNLTHPFKVVESKAFRSVGEWAPPFRPGNFPPVARFWIVLTGAVACLLALLLLRRPTVRTTKRQLRRVRHASGAAHRSSDDPPSSGINRTQLNVLLFDLAAVGIGLCMAMFARRFAPVFYILATPTMASWMVRLAGSLSARRRRAGRWAMAIGASLGAAALIATTSHRARAELVKQVPHDGNYDLLDRVTCNYQTPRLSLEFLRRNGFTPNLMTEWKWAGSVMFGVPGAKVFIDGRAQQVYSEEQYKTYLWLTSVPSAQAQAASDLLERAGTDMVLVPLLEAMQPLLNAMSHQPRWQVIIEGPEAVIWVRQGSPLLDELIRRERTDDLYWPNGMDADRWRNYVRLGTDHPSSASGR